MKTRTETVMMANNRIHGDDIITKRKRLPQDPIYQGDRPWTSSRDSGSETRETWQGCGEACREMVSESYGLLTRPKPSSRVLPILQRLIKKRIDVIRCSVETQASGPEITTELAAVKRTAGDAFLQDKDIVGDDYRNSNLQFSRNLDLS